MFGYVMANGRELKKPERRRYSAVYCGICRNIRDGASNLARFGLSYDMAFLALLLMSLYEPEEQVGSHACLLHPSRHWTDNEYIRYAADMNIVLGYYNCMDDYTDEGKKSAKFMANVFSPALARINAQYPRQCAAIADCLSQLSALEKENCPNPDLPAGCFGKLMAELLVYREDRWAETLRQMGDALGRFIYLADAACDYRRDRKKQQYNPFIAMETGESPDKWEQYLVLEMGCCADHYQHLPLVQDKAILDNILYSGIWLEYRSRLKQPKNSEVTDD